ncbi:MAG: hypothetical protein WCB68_23170 [Pyrinomonadaceae bacterium]
MSNILSKVRNVKGIRGVVYRAGQLQQRSAFALRGVTEYLRLRSERNGHRPQIAAVIVGRNDDYMSDFMQRLRLTIAWNAHHLASEVIFVEWNPPPERELLSPALALEFPTLRAYVVPPEIHDAICENRNIKLLEYHAKNVGLRRAASPFIITTNADAAFAFDSIRTILQTPLSDDLVLTTERIDIPWREGREREINLFDCLRYRRLSPYYPSGTGEFHFASRALWHRARGYDESMVRHRIGCDTRGIAQMIKLGAHVQKAGMVFHLSHPSSCIEGLQPHHGEWANADENLPYRNGDDWGLGDCREIEIAERVWRLEKQG